MIQSQKKGKKGKKGKIESRVDARAKRKRIQDVVLRSLYAGAAIGLMVMAPNTPQLLKYVEKYIADKPNLNRRISQAATRLAKKGLLVRNAEGKFELTVIGRKHAENLEARDLRAHIPHRWDKKWRIVTFDIWERRRAVRDKLRTMLERNGFVRLQNSLWVYPYECEELLVLLRTDLSLGNSVLYIVAEEIENDGKLRSKFGLAA